MNDMIFTFIVIPILIIITFSITTYIRKKVAKPKYEKTVQKPGKLESFILKLLTLLAMVCAILMVLGIVMKEVEMAVVGSFLTLFFSGIIVFLKQEYNISYQENHEYFIVKAKKKEYQVFYENIIDWQPSFNEIRILDKSRSDRDYIRVNITIFKPEILLRKIAEMTMEGKFQRLDHRHPDDLNRENEFVNYLVQNNYGYLIEDDIEKWNQKSVSSK